MILAAKRRSEAVLSFAHARELDARYGTPLLAVAPSGIQDAYRTMRDRLAGVELFYAAKANSDPLVLEALQVVGSAIDVCSVNEMQAALAAGFAIERMIHTHPCKSEANLRECYERGIRRFVYDNVNELDKFVRHAAGAELMLRVGVSGPSSALNLSRKFGARQDEAIELLLAAQRKGLRANGISMHIGSQCMDPSDYDIAFAKIRAIYDQAIRHGIDLQMIDIGGGFPAP